MSAKFLWWFKRYRKLDFLSEKGVGGVVVLIIIVMGIVGGTYIVQQQTRIFSWANDDANNNGDNNGGNGDNGCGGCNDNNSVSMDISPSNNGDNDGNGDAGPDGPGDGTGDGSGDGSGDGTTSEPSSNDGQSLSDQSEQTQKDFEAAYGADAGKAWANEHNANLDFESWASSNPDASLSDLATAAVQSVQQNGAGIHSAAGMMVEEAASRGATVTQAAGVVGSAIHSAGGTGWDAMTGAADGAHRASQNAGLDAGATSRTVMDAGMSAGTAGGLRGSEIDLALGQLAGNHGYPPPNPTVNLAVGLPAVTKDAEAQPAVAPPPVAQVVTTAPAAVQQNPTNPNVVSGVTFAPREATTPAPGTTDRGMHGTTTSGVEVDISLSVSGGETRVTVVTQAPGTEEPTVESRVVSVTPDVDVKDMSPTQIATFITTNTDLSIPTK